MIIVFDSLHLPVNNIDNMVNTAVEYNCSFVLASYKYYLCNYSHIKFIFILNTYIFSFIFDYCLTVRMPYWLPASVDTVDTLPYVLYNILSLVDR